VLQDLTDVGGPLYDATHVVVSGGSAGGLAAVLHLHQIQDALRTTTKMAAIMDGGFFPEWDKKQASGCPQTFSQIMQSVYDLSQARGSLPKGCIQQQMKVQDRPFWKCMFPANVIPDITVPILIIQSKYDSYQISDVLGYSKNPENSPQLIADVRALGLAVTNQIQWALRLQNALQFRSVDTNGTVATEAAASSAAFVYACSHHNMDKDHEFIGIVSQGTSARLATHRWVNRVLFDTVNLSKGGNQKFWIDTAKYPCQSCCAWKVKHGEQKQKEKLQQQKQMAKDMRKRKGIRENMENNIR